MPKLYAKVYTSDLGFFFETGEEYDQRIQEVLEALGLGGEGIDIQFIEGEEIDRELFDVLHVHQGNVSAYLDAVKTWDEDDKIKVIIGVRGLGADFELGEDTLNSEDMELYAVDGLRALAIQFVEEGFFGDIPLAIGPYVDYEAIVRDLRYEYKEITVAGNTYAYHYY